MADWLRLAGFELRTHTEAGGQFGFKAADGRVAGHADGIIVAGPASFRYPMLWENKAVGTKTFRDCKRNGWPRAVRSTLRRSRSTKPI
ncbi:hypothetical protein GLE_5502 [Lysobacter enzymogenes]|uniref:Uncharacterized protein n=1 Tax=Lysobacter enzymogenes TaxID=69 RepID=A0A0S2DQ20_LYSEN|nr:hypothetical protein GLE_5502 [Lysobacter enzymogenes]